ncbi:hypothetical protein [Sphingomonas sp. TWP1-3-1]|uniref:hypothetical protein n=1 Tax=Sphingomonas sp. TWP1-3-1 TaxID=2804612 RepID=UPI003CEF30E3
MFATAWAGAIEAAYETLEARLLAYALGEAEGEAEAESEREPEAESGRVVDGDAAAALRGAHFDPRVAVQALGFRKRAGGAAGGGAGGSGAGTLCKRVSLAELEAVLFARLDALDAQASSVTGDA